MADIGRGITLGLAGVCLLALPASGVSAQGTHPFNARDLWAVVHYVKSLLRLQGTPEAKALQKRLRGT